MASCVRNIRTNNYQNLTIDFQVTVENVGDVFLGTQCRSATETPSHFFHSKLWQHWKHLLYTVVEVWLAVQQSVHMAGHHLQLVPLNTVYPQRRPGSSVVVVFSQMLLSDNHLLLHVPTPGTTHQQTAPKYCLQNQKKNNVHSGPKKWPNLFYQNYVKCRPNLIIFGTQIAKMTKLCMVHSCPSHLIYVNALPRKMQMLQIVA